MTNRHTLGIGALVSLSAAIAAPAFALQPLIAQHSYHIVSARLGSTIVGNLDPAQTLVFALALPLPNQNALDNFVRSVYNPQSPTFHHFLKRDEFANRFGPTLSDYQSVIAFVKAQGLTVTGTFPSRTVVDVTGPVSVVQKTFHVIETLYKRPDGTTFYAPDRDPSLDDSLKVPLLGVSGLDNADPPHSNLRYDLKPMPLFGATGPKNTFSPIDFDKAYSVPPSLNGAGITLGVFQWAQYIPSDITTFEDQFHLRHVPLDNKYLDQATSANRKESGEATIDVEMQVAMAPGAKKEIVYIGNGPLSTLTHIANDDEANTLSSSLGWDNGTQVAENVAFEMMAAQGQSFFVASGDGGAWKGTKATSDNEEDQPYITCVGGTCLKTNSTGGWSSETSWNNGGKGSGGGASVFWSLPSYQESLDMAAIGGSTTLRDGPDIALDANFGISCYIQGVWHGNVGGTSFSAPLWAGIAALIDQQRAANGLPTIGFMNPALYAIGEGPRYASDFHDIQTNEAGTVGTYSSGPGYDLKTGWGTPIISALVADLSQTLAPGPVRIINVKNGLALDGAANTLGALTALNAPDGTAGQLWIITGSGNGCTIVNEKSGLALNGRGRPFKLISGNQHLLKVGQQPPLPTILLQPWLQTPNGSRFELWKVTRSGTAYTLQNVRMGRSLGLYAKQETLPWLNATDSAPDEQWKLVP